MSQDDSRRKLSRREFLIASASTAGAAILAACSGGASTSAPAAPKAAAPTTAPAPAATTAPAAAAKAPAATATPLPLPQGAAGKLTVIHRTEYFASVQEKFKKTVEDFAKAQNIQLDISTANSELFGDFKAKMLAAVQAGVPPDISYNTDSVPQSYSLDILEDVTDVVDELVKMYGAVVPATAEKSAKINGKWWAVPFISNCGSWFARKDWLDAKGIQPAAYATWEGRRDVALQISDPAKEQWAWGVTVNKSGDGHGIIMDCIHSFGGAISDVTGKKVTFNSPATIEAVTFLADIYTNPKWKPMLPPGVESWTDTSNNEAFLAGKISFTQNALSVYGQLKRDKNPILANTILIRKPSGKDGKLLESGGSGWFNIFKGAKNKDKAKQLIFELLKPANFTPMVQEGGGLFLPAYKNMWTEDISKMDPNFAQLKDIIFNPDPYLGTSHPANPSALHDAVLSESLPSQMMSNVISGKMTAAAAVKDAHDRMVRLWEEGGIKQ